MSLFGRRKPGFAKEKALTEDDLIGEFSDRNDPAMLRDANPKDEKTIMGERAQAVMDGKAPDKEAESEKEKVDLFDYLESLPEVDDPFEPDEAAEQQEMDKPDELRPGEILAQYIRERTAAAMLTARKDLESEEENLQALIDEIRTLESCADIKTVVGKKDEYYYSEERMANNYAMIAALVLEKDIPYTIAQMVSFNCRTYPAPTPLYYFKRSPYYLTPVQIEQALKVIAQDETKRNIRSVKAMNGVVYLYDEEVMSMKYARALANHAEAGEADF